MGGGGDEGGERGWWAGVGSLMVFMALAQQWWAFAQKHSTLPSHLERYVGELIIKFRRWFNRSIEITFAEYTGDQMKSSQLYGAIETYLAGITLKSATRLKAKPGTGTDALTLSMADYEEITDSFKNIKVLWSSEAIVPNTMSISMHPGTTQHQRYYRLTFDDKHRDDILGGNGYICHVVETARKIGIDKRQRKLYTNISKFDYNEYRNNRWSHVVFEHPATFATVAMEQERKQEIMDDLDAFKNNKEYYARIGKPWKRGYLLYGPPGTGKSTMIAAMANHLEYDIYDLELTAVRNNSALRKLLIETTGKSIMVIEDIDCSLDLTGKRKGKREKDKEDDEEQESQVTLSGLLNFIDGLWSVCVGERIVVFTTNHIEKLDPALIRPGRMDMHIELSYCGFEAFKVLAKNYLSLESHPLFEDIRMLLEEKNITPAQVAECLMLKTAAANQEERAETCLRSLIQTIQASTKSDTTTKSDSVSDSESDSDSDSDSDSESDDGDSDNDDDYDEE